MKKIYLLAAVTLALTACDSNDDNTATPSVAAQISATIGDAALSRAGDTSWAPGDSIGITSTVKSVVGPFINMKYTTETGSEKFTGNPIYFYKPMTLAAYYPFTGTEGTAAGIIEGATTVPNQTKENQPKIDFLYAAQTGVTASDPNVKLTFEHKMSKLTLILKKGNDGTDVSKIVSYRIDGLALQGTFDTATGVCAVKSGAPAETLTMDLSQITVAEKTPLPSLIIFPQTPSGGKARLKLTDSEGQDYACDLTFEGRPVEPGKHYRYTITVSKTGLSVEKPAIADWKTEDAESEAKSDD